MGSRPNLVDARRQLVLCMPDSQWRYLADEMFDGETKWGVAFINRETGLRHASRISLLDKNGWLTTDKVADGMIDVAKELAETASGNFDFDKFSKSKTLTEFEW